MPLSTWSALPETNIAPENRPSLIFQPSIFRCYVSFKEGICFWYLFMYRLDLFISSVRWSRPFEYLSIFPMLFYSYICSSSSFKEKYPLDFHKRTLCQCSRKAQGLMQTMSYLDLLDGEKKTFIGDPQRYYSWWVFLLKKSPASRSSAPKGKDHLNQCFMCELAVSSREGIRPKCAEQMNFCCRHFCIRILVCL